MTARKPVRTPAAFTALACGALAFAFTTAPARAQSGSHLEIIHHPNYDKSVFMPFSPAIKIKSGKILWLAGGTALPVYHDHPHKREQILKYLTNDLESQVDAGGGPRELRRRRAHVHLQGAAPPGRHRPRACRHR